MEDWRYATDPVMYGSHTLYSLSRFSSVVTLVRRNAYMCKRSSHIWCSTLWNTCPILWGEVILSSLEFEVQMNFSRRPESVHSLGEILWCSLMPLRLDQWVAVSIPGYSSMCHFHPVTKNWFLLESKSLWPNLWYRNYMGKIMICTTATPYCKLYKNYSVDFSQETLT